jgi:hypothetical protein
MYDDAFELGEGSGPDMMSIASSCLLEGPFTTIEIEVESYQLWCARYPYMQRFVNWNARNASFNVCTAPNPM